MNDKFSQRAGAAYSAHRALKKEARSGTVEPADRIGIVKTNAPRDEDPPV
jgi:hypothetical protein